MVSVTTSGSETATTVCQGVDTEQTRRRVRLFKTAGMMACRDTDIRIRQATTPADLKAAYALVHDEYVQREYITPKPQGIRVRIFEALPEMATFIAKHNNQVVAVMSMVPDSPDLGLPSDSVFQAELGALRREDRRIAEVTNLAVDSEFRGTNVLLELVRCCYAYSMCKGLDDVFAAISPGHVPFVETLLLFEPWGSRRNYSDDTVDMVEGMRFDMRTALTRGRKIDQALGDEIFLTDWFVTTNDHFDDVAISAAEATREFLTPALLRELFVDTGVLSESTRRQRDAIRKRWGNALYDQVLLDTQLASTSAA